ncbi:MAG: hypothetical protein HFF49_12670 [Lawsonibacter sp.]|jgi:hypothetical protein|nr:hypothetical protein [Lawsonibacter sp.]
MDKKQREARRQQEDIALQRGLLWVVGAVVLEALLVLLNRFYFHADLETEVNIYLGLHEVLHVMRMAAPVAVVLALVWTAWQLKQGKKFGLPLIVTIALAAVAVCVHVTLKFGANGMSMLYWLVIAWAVLALVFYIYQREFFLGASACGMSVLALWFARYGAAGRPETLLVLAAIVVVGLGALWLKKNDGVLSEKMNLQFLPKKTSYAVLLVTCLASLAAVVVAMVAGDMVAYYLMFVMVAWLFALFVYYTVKMM